MPICIVTNNLGSPNTQPTYKIEGTHSCLEETHAFNQHNIELQQHFEEKLTELSKDRSMSHWQIRQKLTVLQKVKMKECVYLCRSCY